MSRKKKKYYAVKMVDNQVIDIIVETWEECKSITHGHSAVFKSFTSRELALDYLNTVSEKEAKIISDRCKAMREAKKEKKEYKFSLDYETSHAFEKKARLFHKSTSKLLEDFVKEWVDE